VLVLLVGAGILAITIVRSRMLGRSLSTGSGSDHGDWESALAGYKNLRDKGVLSDEEYRKITTLVEPHVRIDSTRTSGPTRTNGRPSHDVPRAAFRPEPPDHPSPPPSPNPTRN